MAAIREQLTLEDRFTSTLDKYIDKLSRSVEKTEESNSSVSRLTSGALRLATGLRNTIQENQAFYQTEERMAGATGRLVENLSSLENALHKAFTNNEADFYLKKLQSEMQKSGLVWTSSADQMEASDLLVRVGLRQLAQEGRLAASALVENADAASKAAEAQEKHDKKISSVRSSLGKLWQSLSGSSRAEKAYDGMEKQFRRFALTLFSVSRIVNYLKSSLERAPQGVQDSWNKVGNSLDSLFGGTVVSVLQALQPHLDNLTASLSSDAGQKLARGLETLGNVAGKALGGLLDILSNLVTFLGDHFQEAATIAGIALAFFAAQMVLTAAATLAANWPILLFIGLITAVVTGLMATGVTSEQIFSAIGAGAGWLYSLLYNLVADIWNVIAVFAEFFANVFNDPVAAVAHLFFDTFDAILGIVETVAGAIDTLLGTNMSSAVSGFRSKMSDWVNSTFGENQITIDRMQKTDYKNNMDKFASVGADIATSLSDFSLTNAIAAPLGSKLDDISGSVGNIEKTVAMSQEDIKSLVDVAERRYVNNINLTSQTPVINVTGQNTGNTAADRQNLANALRDILLEQVASGTTRATGRAY